MTHPFGSRVSFQAVFWALLVTLGSLVPWATSAHAAAHAPAGEAVELENGELESGEFEDGWDLEVGTLADPLEFWNRRMHKLNAHLYSYVLEPSFVAYTSYVPSSARTAVYNFFENARQPLSVALAAMAGEWRLSTSYLERFAINTSFGLLGFLDVASELGTLPRDAFTAGDLLCVYEVPAGAYLVLPFFGPSNVRSFVGRASDLAVNYVSLGDLYTPYVAGTNVNLYARMRTHINATDKYSLDPYVAARSAFAQKDVECGRPR